MDSVGVAKCAQCEVALQGPDDGEPQSRFACPSCRQGDSREKVEREVADYVQEQLADALGASFDKAVRGSKHIKIRKPVRQPRRYRFYIDRC